jgi:hypothetical protein
MRQPGGSWICRLCSSGRDFSASRSSASSSAIEAGTSRLSVVSSGAPPDLPRRRLSEAKAVTSVRSLASRSFSACATSTCALTTSTLGTDPPRNRARVLVRKSSDSSLPCRRSSRWRSATRIASYACAACEATCWRSCARVNSAALTAAWATSRRSLVLPGNGKVSPKPRSFAFPEFGLSALRCPVTSAASVGSGSAVATTTWARACSTCSLEARIPGLRASASAIASRRESRSGAGEPGPGGRGDGELRAAGGPAAPGAVAVCPPAGSAANTAHPEVTRRTIRNEFKEPSWSSSPRSCVEPAHRRRETEAGSGRED